MTSPRAQAFATALAGAFLASDGSPDDLRRHADALFGRHRPRWLAKVVAAVPAADLARLRQDPDRLARLILEVPAFRKAFAGPYPEPWRLSMPWLPPTEMGARRFPVPPIDTVGDLADWAGLDIEQLLWHADRRGLLRTLPEGPLQHHHGTWVPKRAGGHRLIEAPKPRLRALQRRLLHEVLDAVPPHEAAHGYVRGRSVVSFAAPHAGREVVLRLDLRDFFPSIGRRRVQELFATLGYPVRVARELAALCTTRTPRAVLARCPSHLPFETRRLLSGPHLAQGAPTSAALSNLCAFRLDLRLDALARASGATYTRYADDLAFSGDDGFARGVRSFVDLVAAIAVEEGFHVRPDKTRILGQGGRQVLGGVVVNAHPNAPRDEVDRLKAILHHARRTGLLAQDHEGHADFRAHLRGRIDWVGQRNPARGARLRALLDAVPDRI